MATSFHPEVDGDGRIHRLFLDLVEGPEPARPPH
jgi:5'-phosphate synthase pdxT subunit